MAISKPASVGSTNVAVTGTTINIPTSTGTISVVAGDIVVCVTAIVATTPTVTFSKLSGTSTVGSFATNVTKVQGNINLAASWVKVTGTGTLQIRATSSATITNCLGLIQTYRGASNFGQSATGGGTAGTDISLTLTTLNANSWCVLCCAAIQGATALTAGANTTLEDAVSSNITGTANDLSGFIGSNESALALSTVEALHATKVSGATYASIMFELMDPTRTATDAPHTADVATQNLIKLASVTEAPTTADVATDIVSKIRSATDSSATSDAIVEIFTGLRATTDSSTTADVVTQSKVLLRSATESTTAALSASRTLVLLRTVTEAPTTTDVAVDNKIYNVTVSESTVASVAATRTLVKLDVVSESTATSDSVSRLFVGFRTTTEAPTTADVVTRIIVGSPNVEDFTTTVDSSVRSVQLFRTVTEAPTTADVATDSASSGFTATEGGYTVFLTLETGDDILLEDDSSKLLGSLAIPTTTDVAVVTAAKVRTVTSLAHTSDSVSTGSSSVNVFVTDFARLSSDVPLLTEAGSTSSGDLLLESGDDLLLQDGGLILITGTSYLLLEDGGLLLSQANDIFVIVGPSVEESTTTTDVVASRLAALRTAIETTIFAEDASWVFSGERTVNLTTVTTDHATAIVQRADETDIVVYNLNGAIRQSCDFVGTIASFVPMTAEI